jgi:hypothetical protein
MPSKLKGQELTKIERAALARARKAVLSFSGELATPIVRKTSGCGVGILNVLFERKQELDRILSAKTHLLLRHYEIKASDENRWSKLSARLACDFVPGMQVFEKSGKRGPKRRRTWPDDQYIKLVFQADAIRQDIGSRKKLSALMYELVKRDPREWGRYKGRERSLVTRYHEGRTLIQERARRGLPFGMTQSDYDNFWQKRT